MRPTSVSESVRPRLATQYQSTPYQSNTQSIKQNKWQLISIIAALGLSAAGLVYYFYRRKQSNTASKLSKQASKQLLALQHKLDQIKTSIESMTTTGEVIDIAPWRSELSQLLDQSASQSSTTPSINALNILQAEYALHIVKLFATYHTLRNLMVASDYDPANSESVKSLNDWEVEQTSDLQKALTILESINQVALSAGIEQAPVDQPEGEQAPVHPYVATHLLALELSQRLKDMNKLASTYQALLNNPTLTQSGEPAINQRSDDELLALFMTAPMLGRWADFKSFGEELVRRNGPQVMESFHAAAIDQSIYPDYKLLNDKADQFEKILAKQSARPTTGPSGLMWSKFDVTELILSHDRSYSPNPQLNEQLQMLAAQGKEPKLIRPEINTMPFQVTGAIARMQSPFVVQLPCVGLFTDSGFWLYANAKVTGDSTTGEQSDEVPASMCDIEIVCKKQSSMQNGAERVYVGSFVVRDYALDSQGKKGPMSLEHVFSLEMTIRQS